MTTDEWKETEKRLNAFQTVELLIDGYTVTLILCRENMKLYIAVYINGKMKGKWITEDCEERRRFMCKSKRSLIGRYDKKKGLSRREYEKLKEKYTYYSYAPYFASFKTLKNQFTKNNKNIQLLEKTKEDCSYDE